MTHDRLARRAPASPIPSEQRPALRMARLAATRIDSRNPTLRSALLAALQAEGLPVADVDEPGREFYAYTTDRATLAGFAGLQVTGGDALIRSVVVLPGHRGRGLVGQIMTHILSCARAAGVSHAWLLTESAGRVFERLGFTEVDRTQAPAGIAQLAQFRSLCGPKASLMTVALD